MDAKTLYVIGNGFDLYHGISSSYGQFKEYVRANDSEVFDWVEEYIPAGEYWGDLEDSLAYLDTENIVDERTQFLGSYGDDDWSDSGHHDFQYEIERVATGLSSTLQELFSQWVSSLVIPDPSTATVKLQTIDPEAFYLTFNYTNTLTKLYGIEPDRVLHIHGSEDDGDELVLGHAWQAQHRTPLNREDEDPDAYDHRVAEAMTELERYFEKTFKPSEKIITDNEAFFRGLGSVEEVRVLGHGLSKVDGLYFVNLVEGLKDRPVPWIVAYREGANLIKMRESLAGFGVSESLISFVTWDRI
ncbi:bacteriophage abortive infection AbiH family protein [Pseudomonas putida]|uniref:bacteriophage abortive infection AbiH family protein n=1 Tax=Pseudomonas putida TaxID=303 RepID=UPI0023E453CE|nr:bacteriophage abortive infection AbiH family protein [Pseudomonas putida]MDF3930532.1 bacteriophage abortive infection AbiH family protein [Pseudomonas putida]